MAYDSVFKAGLFAGQTIMVTGGGSGIGLAGAIELAPRLLAGQVRGRVVVDVNR